MISDSLLQGVYLFADLDAGNAVVLFYFMPSCGSCPPPARKVQTMMTNVLKQYLDVVRIDRRVTFPNQENA